ncbi:MAG: hypothetical protein GQ556_02505 [Desulfobacterales bacterium]|nr:hypothetical protein [Desulfobacterales bacterium]
MARPLRIQYPGAYYHVMNRGNRSEDIFITDTDRSKFVDSLADSCETFSVKLIACVLMAMELSYRYSNEKQAEIGAVFGVDYSTVSQSRSRLKAKLKSSRNLNK